jgi:hypothetical protein
MDGENSSRELAALFESHDAPILAVAEACAKHLKEIIHK